MRMIFGTFAGLSMLVAASAANASLIQNGSFELGTAPGDFLTVPGGDTTTITGWSVEGSSVDYIGSHWQASEGTRSIDLSGNAPGTIFQSFATTKGGKYVVSFDYAGNPDNGPQIAGGFAKVDGFTTTFSYNTVGRSDSVMGWNSMSFQFIADSTQSTLMFGANSTSSAYGPALDNVSVVSAVPLPASLPLFGGALLALAGIGYFKRRWTNEVGYLSAAV